MINTTPYANSIFEQPWWLDIVAPESWKEIEVTNDKGETIARMPYVFHGSKAYIPKLTQNIGIWIKEELRHDYGAQKKIIYEIFSRMEGIKNVEIALNPHNKYVLPFRWLGCSIEPRFTYRITELDNLEKLYSSFNKTAKKNIKYARNKVKLYYEYNPEHLWTLYEKTFSAQNRNVPTDKNYMLNLAKLCIDLGHGRYVEATDDFGNIHSCALFVYDENVCYYLLGATDSALSKSGSQSLILWDGIQFAAEHSKIFDFEGSMVEGIENFFRQFGGICTPYYVIHKETVIDEFVRIMKPHLKRILGYKV